MDDTIHPLRPAPVGGSGEDWAAWANAIPASVAMGVHCLEIESGRILVEVTASPLPLNPNGAAHGGMVLAWADHTFGLLATTSLPAGASPATAAMAAQFLRPAFLPLRLTGTVMRSGRTLSFVTVEVRSMDGQVAVVLSGTMSVDGTSRFLPDSSPEQEH